MRALFHDPSAVEHQNPVGIAHRGQPVRHDDAGAADQRIPQARQNPGLGVRIHRTERIVQHEHRRILRQCPGNGGSLLLAAGEIDTPLAQHGVVAIGQGRERLGELRDLRYPLEPAVIRCAEQDVAPQGLAEEKRLLRHEPDRAPRSGSESCRRSTPSMSTAPRSGS